MLRLELGLTQMELASKLNKSFATINRWENEKDIPSRDNSKGIISFARLYGASEECISYLCETLTPGYKRLINFRNTFYPDIDKEYLNLVTDNSVNSIYIIEENTFNLLYVNRETEKNAIFRLEQIGINVKERKLKLETDKHCYHYFANLDQPCSFCPLKKFNNTSFKNQIIETPDKKIYQMSTRYQQIQDKNVIIVYLTDITENNKERLALYSITDEIPTGIGIYHTDRDCNIELDFMNKQLFQMIGKKRQEAINRNELSGFCLVHPDDKEKLREVILKSIEDKKNGKILLRMKIRDEDYHNIQLSMKLLKAEDNKFTYLCKFLEENI